MPYCIHIFRELVNNWKVQFFQFVHKQLGYKTMLIHSGYISGRSRTTSYLLLYNNKGIKMRYLSRYCEMLRYCGIVIMKQEDMDACFWCNIHDCICNIHNAITKWLGDDGVLYYQPYYPTYMVDERIAQRLLPKESLISLYLHRCWRKGECARGCVCVQGCVCARDNVRVYVCVWHERNQTTQKTTLTLPIQPLLIWITLFWNKKRGLTRAWEGVHSPLGVSLNRG